MITQFSLPVLPLVMRAQPRGNGHWLLLSHTDDMEVSWVMGVPPVLIQKLFSDCPWNKPSSFGDPLWKPSYLGQILNTRHNFSKGNVPVGWFPGSRKIVCSRFQPWKIMKMKPSKLSLLGDASGFMPKFWKKMCADFKLDVCPRHFIPSRTHSLTVQKG